MVLILKVNMDTRGIGLLEAIWKAVEVVIDARNKKVIQFHDFLHGFCAGSEAGTTIMEIKIAQELASVDQDPLFLLSLGLSKDYDNLDCGQLLQTLAGYGEELKP